MKTALSFVFVMALALSLTGVALAQAPGQQIGNAPAGGTDIGSTGPITTTGQLVDTILNIVNWFAWFVGLLAVVMGLWAGILFITAGGDAAKLSTARNILLYAIIGIAVAVLAFSLVAISRAIFVI